MAPLLPVFVLFFFYTTCGFSASEMPPAVSCCVSLRGLASLKRTLTGCWINGCGINKGWGTICGFFFFFYDTHFAWCPFRTALSNVVWLNFCDTFASAASDAVLWQSVAFIQVCVWITHIFYFFLLAVVFLYTSYGGQQLSEYTSNLYLIPPPGTCVLWRCRIKKTSIRNSAHIQAWRVVSLKETTEQSHSVPGRPLAPRKTIFDVLLSSFDWFTAHHEQRHPLWWALLKYSPAQRFMHI